MDRKTLDYMSERVKKGKEIIAKIEHLTKLAERLPYGGEIQFRDKHGNIFGRLVGFEDREVPNQSRFMNELREALIKLINEEIDRLERELAEL